VSSNRSTVPLRVSDRDSVTPHRIERWTFRYSDQRKLEPMAPDRKGRWNKEVGWLLSVADHIVEFLPRNKSWTTAPKWRF
jgi:hypothetical protein